MFRNIYLKYAVILVLFISFSGCSSIQRKFTRNKKKEGRPAPVITTFDYSEGLRVDELYKKHFLFWKSWQGELVDRMEATYKKRVSCYDYTMSNLLEMEKYLREPKAGELLKFIDELRGIEPDIRKKQLSKSEIYKLSRFLENTKRRIGKQFSYPQVKDYLELKR